MFKEPLQAWLATSIIGRAQKKGIIKTDVESILDAVGQNHHLVDDTPYGGGPGELMKIDVIAPLIKNALEKNPDILRTKKRVLLMDPAGIPFNNDVAKRLSTYSELIFVCGRYEGFDARVHFYVDEAISVGDFVLSAGDLAAMVIFDATARFIEGVLGNQLSVNEESHADGRLEGSLYTRPSMYEGRLVPDVFQSGNHGDIKKARKLESIVKTAILRPDLIIKNPFDESEEALFKQYQQNAVIFPWMKAHD